MVQKSIYMKQIVHLIDNELIKVITGIRRCGKSYMLNLIKDELLKRGIKEENIILINLEDIEYIKIQNREELDKIIKKIVKNKKDKVYLFFDEIQNVKGWEKSMTGYRVSYNCDIYITGSNSNLLSGELATHLIRRYLEIKMYLFSYNEFLEYKEKPSSKELYNKYIQYGGMPQIVFINNIDKKGEYLEDLLNSILYKDVVTKYPIRDTNLSDNLIRFLFNKIGKTFSVKSISKYYKKEISTTVSNKTISKYLKYLENANLIKKVIKEDLGGKGIVKTNEKYYVTDHGFCEAKTKRNLKNSEKVMENLVYIELLKRNWEVTIGRINNHEINFVCKKANKKIYIQVCPILTDEETIEREFRPPLEVKDNFPKYVITTDEFDMSQDGIKHLNLLDFLTDYSLIEE